MRVRLNDTGVIAERIEMLKRIVAAGLAYFIHSNRGNYGELTIKKLLKAARDFANEYGDGIFTVEMERFLNELVIDYGAGIPLHLVMVRQFMERLRELGVRVVDGRVMRYIVSRDEAPQLWELSKRDPVAAARFILQKLSD